jgi:hypothetical protein
MENKSTAPIAGGEGTRMKRKAIIPMGIATLLILTTAVPPLRGQAAVQKTAI